MDIAEYAHRIEERYDHLITVDTINRDGIVFITMNDVIVSNLTVDEDGHVCIGQQASRHKFYWPLDKDEPSIDMILLTMISNLNSRLTSVETLLETMMDKSLDS